MSDVTVNFEVMDVTENKKKDLTEKVSLVLSSNVCCNKSESEIYSVNLERYTSRPFYQDRTTLTKLNEKNVCVCVMKHSFSNGTLRLAETEKSVPVAYLRRPLRSN